MAMSTTTSSIRCKTGLRLNHNRTASNHYTEHGKCLKPRRVLCTLYLYDRAYGIPVSKCNLAPSLTWLASKDTLDQLCSGSIVGLGWLSIHIVYLYIHENEVFYHDYDVVSFQKANYTSFSFYGCILWRKYIFIYETSLRMRQSFCDVFYHCYDATFLKQAFCPAESDLYSKQWMIRLWVYAVMLLTER